MIFAPVFFAVVGDNESGNVDLLALEELRELKEGVALVRVGDAVVSDEGEREDENLARVRGVGDWGMVCFMRRQKMR